MPIYYLRSFNPATPQIRTIQSGVTGQVGMCWVGVGKNIAIMLFPLKAQLPTESELGKFQIT